MRPMTGSVPGLRYAVTSLSRGRSGQGVSSRQKRGWLNGVEASDSVRAGTDIPPLFAHSLAASPDLHVVHGVDLPPLLPVPLDNLPTP